MDEAYGDCALMAKVSAQAQCSYAPQHSKLRLEVFQTNGLNRAIVHEQNFNSTWILRDCQIKLAHEFRSGGPVVSDGDDNDDMERRDLCSVRSQ
jgi:hypothetical protein